MKISQALHYPSLPSNSTYKKVPIDLDPIGRGGRVSYLLENVLTDQECRALIDLSETEGFTTSPDDSSGSSEPILTSGLRHCQIFVNQDREFAEMLFTRIRLLLPEHFSHGGGYRSKLLEIHDKFWFLKFSQGDEFKPHADPCYIRPDGSSRTWVTLHVYLNDNYEGGELTFLASGAHQKNPVTKIVVNPKRGMVVVFQHNLFHESCVVTSGQKYCLKLDVLFEVLDSPENVFDADHSAGCDKRKFNKFCCVL